MNEEILEKIRRELPLLPPVEKEELNISSLPDFSENLTEEHSVASTKEIQARLDICEQCEFFNQFKIECYKCGCFLRIKTVWKKEKCPLNKW